VEPVHLGGRSARGAGIPRSFMTYAAPLRSPGTHVPLMLPGQRVPAERVKDVGTW